MNKLLIFTTIIACLSISVLAKGPKWHSLDGYTFEEYVRDFKKAYKHDSEEFNQRKSIFLKKLEEIMSFNNSTKGYRKGVNQFTDMTKEEHSKVSFGLKSTSTESTFERETSNQPITAEQLAELPTFVDWRQKGVVSPVKDQGQCGSCWAFSAVSTIESHAAIASSQLKTLSTEQLVSCVENPLHCGGTGGCDGADAELAYTYLAKAGLTSEFKYSYNSYFGDSLDCVFNSKKQTVEVTIGGFQKLPSNDYAALLKAVAQIGPIDVSIDASSFQDYESGVFTGCTSDENVDLDHAVVIVGYGTDEKYGDYWLVRNSWGTSFGENGYIRVQRDSVPVCKWDITPQDGSACEGDDTPILACGQCGILYSSSYPTNVKVIG